MTKRSDFRTIDEYLGTFSGVVREKLEEMREVVHEAAPEAEETISYQIPTYKLNGKNLVHFAGFEHHIGFYPAPSAITAFKTDLMGYKQAKGSVQFPTNKPIPAELVEKMVKFRIIEENSRQK